MGEAGGGKGRRQREEIDLIVPRERRATDRKLCVPDSCWLHDEGGSRPRYFEDKRSRADLQFNVNVASVSPLTYQHETEYIRQETFFKGRR